jgi:hypothetical protein
MRVAEYSDHLGVGTQRVYCFIHMRSPVSRQNSQGARNRHCEVMKAHASCR